MRYIDRLPGEPDANQGVFGYDMSDYLRDRTNSEKAVLVHEKLGILQRWAASSVKVPVDLCIRTHRFRIGGTRLVAFERNVDYHMSEDLKQAGGNEALETAVSFVAQLENPKHVYELQSGKYLGEVTHFEVQLDPWKPSLYALLPKSIEGDVVAELLKTANRGGE